MLTFIRKVFMHQKKNYFLLLIILTILASFEFCFIAMYDHFTYLPLDVMTFMIVSFIPFIALAVSIILIIFTTKYFIQNKQHEFAMLLLFGRKPKELFLYLVIQYGLLLFVSFLIGIGLGIFFMHAIHIIFDFTFLYDISYTIFIFSCFFFITLLLVLAVAARQFTDIDCHIMETLTKKTKQPIAPYKISMSSHNTKYKIPILFICISLLELSILFYSLYAFITVTSLQSKLIYFFFCLSAIIYLVNNLAPLFFDLFYNHIIQHPLLFHSMTGYMHMTHQLSSITSIHILILPIIFMLLTMCQYHDFLTPLVISCFIMILIMLLLSFTIKYTLYLQSLQKIYATQIALGYHSLQLIKILLLKNIIFFLFIVFIPYLYIHYLGHVIITNHILQNQIVYCLEIFYLIFYSLFILCMTFKEKQFLKEVTSHVKYLNRSE